MAEAEVGRAYADHVRALAEAAPPLTEAQRRRIAGLLSPPASGEAPTPGRRVNIRESA